MQQLRSNHHSIRRKRQTTTTITRPKPTQAQNKLPVISKLPVSEPAEVANAFNEFFTNMVIQI